MDRKKWNEIIRSFPDTQLLQHWEWGEVKEEFGWKASREVWKEGVKLIGAAQILEREIKRANKDGVDFNYNKLIISTI